VILSKERFLAMVDQKVKGREIAVQPPTPERRGKVVDLMSALKQSLEGAAPQRQRHPEPEPGTKPGCKRRKA